MASDEQARQHVCKFCGVWRSEFAEIVTDHEDSSHSRERIAELRAEVARLTALLAES